MYSFLLTYNISKSISASVRFRVLLLITIFLTLHPVQSEAEDIFTFFPGSSSLKIKTTFFDSDYDQSFSEISSLSYADSFSFKEGKQIYVDDEKVHWVKVEITSQQDQEMLFEMFDFRLGNVDLFDNTGSTPRRVGYNYPFSVRPVLHKNFVFPLHIKKGDQIIYLRIQTTHPAYIAGAIKSKEEFTSYALQEYVILGLFYGLIFILILYNLLLYISTRFSSIKFYIFYLVGIVFLATSKDGLAFQFIWPSYPVINKFIFPVAELLVVVGAGLYARSFLHLKLLNKRLDYVVLGVIAMRIFLSFVFVLFDKPLLYIQSYDVIPLTVYFFAGVVAYRNGVRSARFYMLAFTLLFTGFLITVLTFMEVFPVNAFTIYSVNIAVILEMFFLSVGISDSIKLIVREKQLIKEKMISELKEKEAIREQMINHLQEKEHLKDKVNRELEMKVGERTAELEKKAQELAESNLKLSELTQRLNEINARLDKENWTLNKEVREKTKSHILAEYISYEEFSKVFPDDLSCLRHLEDLKWGNGYSCKKCGNSQYSETQRKFSRKCTKCDHIESVTAETLFHAIKFPLNKAFYIVYVSGIAEKKITLTQLSETLDLRMNTCSDFRKKVLQRKEDILKKTRKAKLEKWEELVLSN